ncbi:hypothetical protein [Mucilaginibacter sp.]|uniref:hypothetical protein n=1 Tax=Mucilaginibacter sp. TaxID=1882438 RepID=UPI002636C153|nr:hypothetical protein [Mucilaginibacter sp.]MDB4919848.1 hypothetical protein [Mucilaginibacter sp.]
MHTLTFTYKNTPMLYRGARNWNQLTAVQLLRWSAVAFGQFTDGERVRLALIIIYGIPAKIYGKIPDHILTQVAPTIAYLFEGNELTRWLIKKVKIGFRSYHGPADILSNLSANEFFNYTEVVYQQCIKASNSTAINVLCAILYRQKRKTEVEDDLRCKLTDAGIALRARKMEALHPHVKTAILLNYEGCRAFIIKHHPDIFIKGKNGQQTPKAADLVLSLSDGPFGNYNQTQGANLYKFLEHMQRVIKQAEEAKAKP